VDVSGRDLEELPQHFLVDERRRGRRIELATQEFMALEVFGESEDVDVG
jgi:hypothetical protein